MQKHIFTNSFESWHETHYEIVQHLTQTLDNDESMAYKRQEIQGHGGLYELAQELTDEFEKLYAFEEWVEKGYWETIEQFLDKKEKEYGNCLEN